MSYTALYRKFRPQGFEDVKGQDHIVTTLKNQIKAGRIGHAYLFCGTRGTGKTTVAKIFAKAVNCEHPVDGSPCGTCEACRMIAAGVSLNVVEVDAASNNGVDYIRQINEETEYAPTEGKYRVYIIDEAHMLSASAFNAFLKTLEEPPSYVIFILATTELHKIPITILSRCQRYDFHRISVETISARLTELLQTEGVQAEERAIRYVAKMADGSMRDAISLLDQCIAFYLGQELTYDRVLDVLGAVDTEIFGQFFRKIVAQDVSGVIRLLEEVVIQGRELTQFVNDFTWYLRDLLLLNGSDGMEDALEMSAENLSLLQEEAKMADPMTLIRYIRIFSDLSGQIRYSGQKRILIEVALIKLCKPQMQQDQSAILDRIRQIEQRLEQGVPLPPRQETANLEIQPSPPEQKEAPLPKAVPEKIKEAAQHWDSILQGMTGTTKAYLKHAKLSVGEDNTLLVVCQDALAADYLNREAHKHELEEEIAKYVAAQVEVKIQPEQADDPSHQKYIDLKSVIRMGIDIEDDMDDDGEFE